MKHIVSLILIFLSVYGWVSCDDMNSIHQKYLDEGEDVYLGYPDIVAACAGYERIRLEWKLNADPKIDTCCIYWNNRQDSVSVLPDRTEEVMKHIIPLPEGKYVFQMVNKSKNGYRSLTNTTSAESYGEIYREGLYNRVVKEQKVTADNLTLTWSLEEGCVGIDLSYVNTSGELKKVFIEGDQSVLVLEDYVPGGTYVYTSLFLPEPDAIDIVPAKEVTGTFPE